MDIREIQTFAVIAKTGSFQKAAEILQYSQPTISMRIKQLEAELKISLFERGKTLQLTPAGQLFYEKSQTLLANYAELDLFAEQLHNEVPARSLTIGVSDPTASLIMPQVIQSFHQAYPTVSVHIQVADANTCSQALKDGTIAFAICGAPYLILDHYYEPIFYDELNLLVSEQHPLANRQVVTLADLRNEVFLFTPENCPVRIQIEQHLRQSIGNQYRKMEVTTSLSHKYYVRENAGISLFTATAHSEQFSGTKVVAVKDLPIHPPIGLLTPSNQIEYDSLTLTMIRSIVDTFDTLGKKVQYPKIVQNKM
uniref:LysR family transcriptional regulator n=1 Tax=Candidatus Enterococcus willemsii TaxID=1857215 RepID=UPI00403FAC7B